MKVSILICSFSGSKHLGKTIETISNTFPKDKYDMELLVDCESKRTGLTNTTKRYMELYKKSLGEIIVKSDDDVCYYSGWFEQCLQAIQKDDKIGYISPISHHMMKTIGVKRASDERIPIDPKNEYKYEDIASGMCWVFKRDLWKKIPYSLVGTWYIDDIYVKLVTDKGLKAASLQGALISHLGQDRYKGVDSDVPGYPPSDIFKKQNPKTDFRIF